MKAGNSAPPAAVLLLSLACAAAALEITKAEVSGGPGTRRADLTLSGAISLKGVSLEKDAVVMPLASFRDRSYSDLRLLSKELYLKLHACLAGGACSAKAGSRPPAVRVEAVRLSTASARAASVEVSFDGEMSAVVGVVKSRYGGDWLAYPPGFKMRDAGLKAAVDRAVREAYSGAASGRPPE